MKEWVKDMAPVLRELFWLALAVALVAASLYFYPVSARAEMSSLQTHAAIMEKKYELPAGMLRAICDQESRWRNVAGRHGEIGVCQVKPGTVAMVCPDCVHNAGRTVFALGSRGDHVLRIQAVLAREKMYAAEIDGVYGPQTQAAVIRFQRTYRLMIDGIVGAQTWSALFGQGDPFPAESIVGALWDPHKNIEWAARYLAWLRDRLGNDPTLMIAAYNGGPAHPVVVYAAQVKGRIPKGSGSVR